MSLQCSQPTQPLGYSGICVSNHALQVPDLIESAEQKPVQGWNDRSQLSKSEVIGQRETQQQKDRRPCLVYGQSFRFLEPMKGE